MVIENDAYKVVVDEEKCEVEFTVKNRIPVSVVSDIVNYFADDLTKEAIVQVWHDEDGYKVVKPCIQSTSKAAVEYSFPVNTKGKYIATIHSHNTFEAFFSPVDDADELQVPGLYGVIGKIHESYDGEILFDSIFRYTFTDCNPVILGLEELFDVETANYY